MPLPDYAGSCTLFDVKDCTTCAYQCERAEPVACERWKPRQNVRFEYSPPCWRAVVRTAEAERLVPEGCWDCPCLDWRDADCGGRI